MTDTDLLYSAIKDAGLKLSYVADKLGISAQALRLKATNKSSFTATEIDLISKLLDKDVVELKDIFFAPNVD